MSTEASLVPETQFTWFQEFNNTCPFPNPELPAFDFSSQPLENFCGTVEPSPVGSTSGDPSQLPQFLPQPPVRAPVSDDAQTQASYVEGFINLLHSLPREVSEHVQQPLEALAASTPSIATPTLTPGLQFQNASNGAVQLTSLQPPAAAQALASWDGPVMEISLPADATDEVSLRVSAETLGKRKGLPGSPVVQENISTKGEIARSAAKKVLFDMGPPPVPDYALQRENSLVSCPGTASVPEDAGDSSSLWEGRPMKRQKKVQEQAEPQQRKKGRLSNLAPYGPSEQSLRLIQAVVRATKNNRSPTPEALQQEINAVSSNIGQRHETLWNVRYSPLPNDSSALVPTSTDDHQPIPPTQTTPTSSSAQAAPAGSAASKVSPPPELHDAAAALRIKLAMEEVRKTGCLRPLYPLLCYRVVHGFLKRLLGYAIANKWVARNTNPTIGCKFVPTMPTAGQHMQTTGAQANLPQTQNVPQTTHSSNVSTVDQSVSPAYATPAQHGVEHNQAQMVAVNPYDQTMPSSIVNTANHSLPVEVYQMLANFQYDGSFGPIDNVVDASSAGQVTAENTNFTPGDLSPTQYTQAETAPFNSCSDYTQAIQTTIVNVVQHKPPVEMYQTAQTAQCNDSSRPSDNSIEATTAAPASADDHSQIDNPSSHLATFPATEDVTPSCGVDRNIKLWAVGNDASHTPLSVFPGKSAFNSIDHHQSDPLFATTSNLVQIWDETKSAPISNITFPTSTETISSVRFNLSEKSVLASIGSDRTFTLYDIRTGKAERRVVMQMRSNALAWSPTFPTTILLAPEDHNLYTFDIRHLSTPTQIYKAHVAAVMSCDWSPTGLEFVSGGWDRTVRIWKEGQGHSPEVYHTKRMQRVSSSIFSGDARFVITGSDEGNVRIWKAKASEKLGVVTARERAAIEYRESLKERWKMDAEVGKVSRTRHLPKSVYQAGKLKRTMLEAQRVKEERRRKHTRAGETKPKAARKTVVLAEQT